MKRAFLMVDIQNDFVPSGALPTRKGDEVIAVANLLQPRFELVVATQDWHPATHRSFASMHPGKSPGDVIDLNGLEQVLWPDHCVQGSRGAELHPALDRTRLGLIIQKGTDPQIDSYSGFFDNGHRKSTELEDYLASEAATDVYIAGLATDYCVRWTALDALKLGFATHVVVDACRGVELQPGDIARAIEVMRAAGARIVTSGKLLSAPRQ
jgi:nicotinamidase/pyrazinamidase